MKQSAWRFLIFLVIFSLPCSLFAKENRKQSLSSVEIRGEWFYVDGEKFLVKGVGYSPWRPHELPWKDPIPLKRMEKDFKRIRAAGFNTLRTWTPLSVEALRLAHQYGLMVIQGIYLYQAKDLSSESYLKYSMDKVKGDVEKFKNEPNVLLILVTNEPPVEAVSYSGKQTTDHYLRQVVQAAKEVAPHIPVSYSNWTRLFFLDTSFLDCAAFNVYIAKPVVIRYATGYYPFLKKLKEKYSHKKPLLVTEFGLAVNPSGKGAFTEAGNNLREQARALVHMWRQILASGAAGGCVFEWNDEWWKNHEYPGDEDVHEDEPEEWYGLLDVDKDPLGEPRPAYRALKDFNQAIVLSPSRYYDYGRQVFFQVNTVDDVGKVEIKIDHKGKWESLSQKGKNWWEATIDISGDQVGKAGYKIRAFRKNGKKIIERQDFFYLQTRQQQKKEAKLEIITIPNESELHLTPGQAVEVDVIFRLTDKNSKPIPNKRIYFSFYEIQFNETLKGARLTDKKGEVHCRYLVQEPGFLIISGGSGYHKGSRVVRVGGVKHFELILDKKKKEFSSLPEPLFKLADLGTEFPVDYAKYGKLKGVGTENYIFQFKDREGLAKAVGSGIYPNDYSLYYDPLYKKYSKEGKLEGFHWDYVATDDLASSFFKWADAPEDPFVRLFYAGLALQRAGLLRQALKAYYAILVHAPGGVGWTYFGTPWSLGKTAIDRIDWITRTYPQLGIRLKDAKLEIKNGFDNNILNDIVICDPGTLEKCDPKEVNPPKRDFKKSKIIKTLGGKKTKLIQYKTGDWECLVDGKPFMFKAVSYGPVRVGNSPHEGTMEDWMNFDSDKNGKADGPYDAWVDKNLNNEKDPDEEVVGDFKLLKEMGVNAIRLYHHASNKELLRELYNKYGIGVILGDFIGMYNVGSGASWAEGTDYRNPEQQKKMLESVEKMVLEHRDEPYVLCWVLGNENNYGGVHGDVGGKGNASLYPEAYYRFVNEAAKLVKRLDPTRPVAICNGSLYLLDKVAKYAPEIDIYGTNAYPGNFGFGLSFWKDLKEVYDRPVLITEYGCPAFHAGKTFAEAEKEQAEYNAEAWKDIMYNSAGSGYGNAIGAVLFQFIDGWWKSGQPPTFSPYIHETIGQFAGPFPGGWFYEEWFGVCGQGNGRYSPFMRQLRQTYYTYQNLWNQ